MNMIFIIKILFKGFVIVLLNNIHEHDYYF